VLVVFVSVFIANPFEASIDADLLDLVPPTAPVFLQAHHLEESYEAVQESRLWGRLVEQEGWRELVAPPPPDTGLPDRHQALRQRLEELAASPATRLGIELLLEDLLGEEVAVALYPDAEGQQLDITLYTRIGLGTKLGFGSVEFFGLRLGLLRPEQLHGATLTRAGPRHLVISGLPGLTGELHLLRERDLLMLSTTPDAVELVQTRLAGGRGSPSLRKRQSYLRATGPLEEYLPGARLAAFLDWDLMARRGIDLDKTIVKMLGTDLRAVLFESIDFSTWKAVGLVIPDTDDLRAEIVVSTDPPAGERGKILGGVYKQTGQNPATLTALPADVAVAKTAMLPFDAFFDLTYGQLDGRTRHIINYYVLDQLQRHAAEVKRAYGELIQYLTRALGDEFTVFVVPAQFEPGNLLSQYFPRFGVVFPARDHQAVRDLIVDIASILPKINPDLFKAGRNQTLEREGALIFTVESEGAPLRSQYDINPMFVVSRQHVVLLSHEDLLQPVLQAMREGWGEVPAAFSELGQPGQGYYYVDGAALYGVLENLWRNEEMLHDIGRREELEQARRRELLEEYARETGVRRIDGELREELERMIDERMQTPEEQAQIQAWVGAYLAPIREQWMAAIEPVRLVDKIVLSANYSSRRIRCSIRVTGR
jgi:hypothetical protein